MTNSRLPMMTSDELKTLIRTAVREELDDAGLRLDGPEHQYAAREDFRFLRRLRNAVDGTASKIGAVVLTALVSGVIYLIVMGSKAFISK